MEFTTESQEGHKTFKVNVTDGQLWLGTVYSDGSHYAARIDRHTAHIVADVLTLFADSLPGEADADATA